MVKNGIIGRSVICASSIASAKAAAPCIMPCSSKWGKKRRKTLSENINSSCVFT